MKTHGLKALAAMGLGLVCSTGLGAFEEGVRLRAGGEVIDVERGHLVPCVTDWNGDGKKDLVVGQLSGGKIRLYLNKGTDSAPTFDEFEYMKAGGEEISLTPG